MPFGTVAGKLVDEVLSGAVVDAPEDPLESVDPIK